MDTPLTPLERVLVDMIAAENWNNFRVDGIHAIRRENTGAGRFTYLEDSFGQRLRDGSYTAQGRLLEIEGVRDGLAFVIDVRDGKLRYLELAVYGNEGWDGVERRWRIL